MTTSVVFEPGNHALSSEGFYQGRGWENLIYTAAFSSCQAKRKEPHQGKLLIYSSTTRFVLMRLHWWPKAAGVEGNPLGRKCFDD